MSQQNLGMVGNYHITLEDSGVEIYCEGDPCGVFIPSEYLPELIAILKDAVKNGLLEKSSPTATTQRVPL